MTGGNSGVLGRGRLWLVAGLALAPATAAAHDPPARSKYSTVVVSNRSSRTASQRVVGPAEISTSPRRRSADDLLRLIPGVYVGQHGSEGKGQQIYLRGFDAAHGTDVEARVAGVPINELSNVHGQGYIDLNFVIPEVVRRISASKGPFLLDQGNFANAGTVRFDLGVDREVRGNRVSYEFGSTMRHRGAFVYAPKHLPKETFFAAEAMHDRGFGVAREAGRVSLVGQVRLLNSPGFGSLDLFGVAYAARFGAPGALRLGDVNSGRVPLYGAYVDDGRGRSSRAIAGLHHQLEVGRGRLEQRLYGQLRDFGIVEDFTGYLLDATRGDRRLQEHRFGALGYQLEYRRPLGTRDRWSLVAGGAWQGDRIAQHDARVDAEHVVYRQNWALDVAQHQAHARAGLRWRPVPRLSIDAGARVDLFAYRVTDRLAPGVEGRKALAIPSPRVTAVVQLARDASLFLAYGRGLRAPEARSILQPAAPPADVPLDRYRGGPARIVASDAVEVGARVGWRDKVSAGVALFGTWIDRELVFDHVSATNIELNRTRRLGADLDLVVRPRPWLVLRQDVTLVHARFVASGAPVPQAPPVMASTQLSLVHPSGFRAGARVFVLGPRPLPHGATAAGYALLDVSLGYRLGPAQFDLQIDNVTNTRWHEGEYHFASWWDTQTPRSAVPALHVIAGPPLTARLGLTLWM